jgi:hypothetical protein
MILVKIQQRLGLAQLLKEELVGLCLLETSYLNFTQEEVLLEALQRITTGLRLNPLKAEDVILFYRFFAITGEIFKQQGSSSTSV